MTTRRFPVKLADVFDNVSDAPDRARGKWADKARRAIELAGNDARLVGAVTHVRDLIAGA